MTRLIFAFLLFPVLCFGQIENTPTLAGKCTMSQSGGGIGFWQVTGNFLDESGYYDATNIQVGDVLFFTDSGKGYHLPVTAINSASGLSFVIEVSNVGITGVVSVPSVLGAIYRPSGSKRLFPYISGLSDPDQQTLNNYLIQLIDAMAQVTSSLSVGSATATVTHIGAAPTFTNVSAGIYRVTIAATTTVSSINFFFNNSHTDGNGDLFIQIYEPSTATYDYWRPEFLAEDTDLFLDRYSDRSLQVSQTILAGLGTLTGITGFNGAFGSDGARITARL